MNESVQREACGPSQEATSVTTPYRTVNLPTIVEEVGSSLATFFSKGNKLIFDIQYDKIIRKLYNRRLV